MPIIKSAVKRMKQTVRRRERNIATKRNLKSAVRAFMEKPSAAGLSKAQSEIDTAVKKNLLPKNTAARRKASLARVAKDAGVKVEATKRSPVASKTATGKAAPAKAKAPAKKPAAKTTTAKTKAPAKAATAKKPAAKQSPAASKTATGKAPAKKAASKK